MKFALYFYLHFIATWRSLCFSDTWLSDISQRFLLVSISEIMSTITKPNLSLMVNWGSKSILQKRKKNRCFVHLIASQRSRGVGRAANWVILNYVFPLFLSQNLLVNHGWGQGEEGWSIRWAKAFYFGTNSGTFGLSVCNYERLDLLLACLVLKKKVSFMIIYHGYRSV